MGLERGKRILIKVEERLEITLPIEEAAERLNAVKCNVAGCTGHYQLSKTGDDYKVACYRCGKQADLTDVRVSFGAKAKT